MFPKYHSKLLQYLKGKRYEVSKKCRRQIGADGS